MSNLVSPSGLVSLRGNDRIMVTLLDRCRYLGIRLGERYTNLFFHLILHMFRRATHIVVRDLPRQMRIMLLDLHWN